MAWTKPQYSRSQVNKAGTTLVKLGHDHISKVETDERDRAIEIIGNWRSSHSRPLLTVRQTLDARALGISHEAYIVQRIKRLSAIRLKLSNTPTMQLAYMHDIGGCRAVMPTVELVEKLDDIYKAATAKNPRRGGLFHRRYDYISKPKASGYRGIHLVYLYYSASKALEIYNDLKIEIQIRSKLQHAWATGVETVDFYTKQALKSNIGDDAWKQFFRLTSTLFAIKENRPIVPETPNNLNDLKNEIGKYKRQLTLVRGIHKATEVIQNKKGFAYLLQLNLAKRLLNITTFSKEQILAAQEEYNKKEIAYQNDPTIIFVLISANSFFSLQKAYPNWFFDIGEFVTNIDSLLN